MKLFIGSVLLFYIYVFVMNRKKLLFVPIKDRRLFTYRTHMDFVILNECGFGGFIISPFTGDVMSFTMDLSYV